jgi:TIR domain/CHAT domain/AAA ATPase domain
MWVLGLLSRFLPGRAGGEMASTLDVFISYGHEDAAWVRLLAENLHRAGFEVFFDEWDILAGDVRAQRLEEGIVAAAAGVVVLSPTSVRRPWVNEEYFALLTRTVAGRQRLIPVLLGDVDLPPFLAGRVAIDFRDADGPEYERRFVELTRALHGERGPRLQRDRLVVSPGSAFRAEGSRRAKLSIARGRVLLAFEGREISHRPGALTHRLEGELWQLQRVRQRGPTQAELAVRAPAPAGVGREPEVQQHLLAVGRTLTDTFLDGPAGAALAEAIHAADRGSARLELALEVEDEGLADLPWETLRLPGQNGMPLVLHPRVALYRSISGLGPTPAVAIPGPLRVLVAIGSPDQGGGELLDTEAELARILDAVDPARRQEGKAYVHILNRGTVDAIRGALQAQRFHVLHISCHAQPGALVLEDDEGNPDLVDAERFAADVLVPGRGVSMVVLSGCSTALADRQAKEADPAGDGQGHADQAPPTDQDESRRPGHGPEAPSKEGEAALAGLARQLLGRGVPTVLAMTAPVTDLYATWLGEQLYRELATQQRPDPLAALSEARRRIEAERRRLLAQPNQPASARQALLVEWATPALFLRGPNLALYDPTEPFETLREPAQPHLPGVVVRGVGDFVGRRREQRQMLRAMRGRRPGLVVHGIGGVGKSTLAAQLVADLGDEAGLVVSVAGQTTTDEVLDTIGQVLFADCIARGLEEQHPLRGLARQLRDAHTPWPDRLDLLARQLLRQEPLLVLVDNFEDDLVAADSEGWRVADAELAAFLAAWVRTPGKAAC